MENNKGRIAYIDSMKGIAIILVLILHSLMNSVRNIDSEYAWGINFVAYIAVPSFFFINGYLYNHKYSLTPVQSIIKKFKAYYIPFVGFSLFFWAFHNVFVYLNLTPESAYDVRQYVINFVLLFAMHMESALNGPMWFLRALLVMVCIFIVVDSLAIKIQNRKIRYAILTIVIVLMYIIGKNKTLPDIYNINKVLFSISYFYFGVLIREFEIDKFIEKHKLAVFIIGALGLLVTSIFFWGGIGVNAGFWDLPGTFLGILAVFSLAHFKYVCDNKVLMLLGNASLDIMVLHFLAFKVPSLIFIATRHLEIERLREIPVIYGTHGIDFLLYVVVGAILCSIEYILRNKIKQRFKRMLAK